MRRLLFSAVSLALCSSVQAQALTTSQAVGTGSITTSVSDTSANGNARTSSVAKTLSFGKFSANTGVLVDVTM